MDLYVVCCLQQNNLFKAREEKYQSRIRVLEALASGTGEETKVQKLMKQKKKLLKGISLSCVDANLCI